MEQEALAAKESLIHFQPFIEGEKILLVTDHLVLTWVKTYENMNQRLAAWGLVFTAFPRMVIIHRPGQIHSNINPVSRLLRILMFISPSRDNLPEPSLSTEYEDLQHAWQNFIKEQELGLEVKISTMTPIKEHELGLHIYASDKTIQQFIREYQKDKTFKAIITHSIAEGSDE